ncbi:SGNH/GDSL hydrolase family protein [Bradyrhizobium sp. DASA03007]|uniref:SGNH/GDSL hydrolase family protein n=1 Tax=unclassified Bradyrhizobium TaxID=2631580 RepID=UPI003F718EF1
MTLSGSSYACVLDHTNHTPPNTTYWQLLASKGDTGATGPTGAGYGGTSTTSLTIGTGSKAFTTQSGLAYQNGARVRASSAANTSNWMEGLATYSGTTLTITVDKTNGSGTLADWNLNIVGQPGAGDLSSANNLSDISDKADSVRNLAPTDLYNGSSRIASYTDLSRNFFGREYLGAYLNSWRSGGGATANVILRGDSTVVGTGLSSSAVTAPDVVLKAVALRKGLKRASVTNSGVSGTTIADWKNTHLPSDLSTYTGGNIPKLYVLNYGMNDPYTGGSPVSVSQSITDLRAGFALLRGTWTGNQTSVVYVMPNTAYDDTGARNELWRELFAVGAKEACRDYGIMFIDSYAQFAKHASIC